MFYSIKLHLNSFLFELLKLEFLTSVWSALPVRRTPWQNLSALLRVGDTVHRFLGVFTFCYGGDLEETREKSWSWNQDYGSALWSGALTDCSPVLPGPAGIGWQKAVPPGWRHEPEPSVHWEAALELRWGLWQRCVLLSWKPKIQRCNQPGMDISQKQRQTFCRERFKTESVFLALCYLCQSSNLCGSNLVLCVGHSSVCGLLGLCCWLHLHWLR